MWYAVKMGRCERCYPGFPTVLFVVVGENRGSRHIDMQVAAHNGNIN
jgi:hypothetical protein